MKALTGHTILHDLFGFPDWDIIAFISAWLFYYVFIHVLYYGGGKAITSVVKSFSPYAAANKITDQNVIKQMQLSEIAFPLYCCVPALGEFLRRKGISRVCDDFESCGGVVQSTFNFLVYMFLVEGGVFFIHYWMLHVWVWGKRNLKHHIHHSFKEQTEMTSWSGYAFEAVDGAAQGLPFVLGQLVVPIPTFFVVLSGAGVGVWTMYIHVGVPHLPWPFMGADYHYLHHAYNWYNFGLFTLFWDGIFKTVRHPGDDKIHRKHTAPHKIAYVAKGVRLER